MTNHRNEEKSASALSVLPCHLPTEFLCFGEDESLHGSISSRKLSSSYREVEEEFKEHSLSPMKITHSYGLLNLFFPQTNHSQ